ncbi:hypothetical protein BG015_002713 [Linnemannia schmuckeri]|uniref:Uncharacterized protein n=1 Tax=Linnemannia schmuckeri TaxID=64567 RepID=A0A9P5S3L5_9FUNG|nr:hypothetical protein BG015_002713 [Linnemannia schmuckeri]
MIVQDQQRNNNIHPRKQHQSRKTTVQDEDKEVLNKFIIVEDDEDNELALVDEEYRPDPEQDDLDEEEKKLEYNEEDDDLSTAEQEEKVAEMAKADEREVQTGTGGGRRHDSGIGGDVGFTASSRPSAKSLMAKNNNNRKESEEREVQPGGGRRRGTGTGGDVASTTSSNKASSTKNSNSDNRDDEGGERVESMHDKRSRAGHTGASAKVGYVASDTAMTRAKFKVEGPEDSDLIGNNKTATSSREPSIPTPYHKKSEDSQPDYDQGFKFWGKIYSSELEGAGSAKKEAWSRLCRLPVWQEICEKAGLALPANQLEAQGREKPDYFKLAHENAEMICEQCYKMTRPAGSFRALPVIVDGDGDDDSKDSSPKMTRMCRDCRVEYYIDHPEPVPDDVAPYKAGDYTVTPRMTKGDAMKTYLLSNSDLMSLPYEIGRNPYFGSNSPMYLFEEQHVLRLARQVHGGDIGIAANRSDSEYAGRKVPEPHDDVVKHRRNLLRSMLHDKGLHLPEHAAICSIYIETGLGDPLEIVKELEIVDWFHRCTSYDPSLDKAHLQQIKRRPRISRRRETRPEGETLMSANTGGLAAQPIKDEVMSEEEEEEDDQHKMVALDDWLAHRLEQGKYRSYKLDPKTPERPPKAIWEMLDKIDMGQKMINFAAEKVYRVLEKKKHELRREGWLDKVVKSKGQIREIVDGADQGSDCGRGGSELSRRKRRRIDYDDEGSGDDKEGEEPKLSTLMEHDVGSDWDSQVLKKAKELVESRLF